jgi:hypothetical protein
VDKTALYMDTGVDPGVIDTGVSPGVDTGVAGLDSVLSAGVEEIGFGFGFAVVIPESPLTE